MACPLGDGLDHPATTRTGRTRAARLLGLLLAAGCLPRPAAPTGTPSPPPAASTAPAFPTPLASATLTPPPSSTPTPDLVAGLGPPIFQDDFTEDLGWNAVAAPGGTVSWLPGRLVLALHSPGGMLSTVSPASEAQDFYLEAELRTELCGQADEFGLMVRVQPNLDHLRFSLTCDGQARVSRFVSGQEAALAPLTRTSAALPGAPALNLLAVWGQGDLFRFLVNDLEVFTLRDGTLARGGFGLAVRSRRSPQITVSLQSFAVYALQAPSG
jgi:hypothetical protein